MAIKLKPQGPKCKRFEFCTKMAKVTKPQKPKWQFTPCFFYNYRDHKPTLNASPIETLAIKTITINYFC
ncbi:hypothetical protein HanRHA438_Chr05g0204051 [Helianthus annuus]|nr:hypothetical protein HanIR_Chr05g0209771 [Helianthus annuus]KAJ0917265.1 hypothetical protein HanRHA438_Chr05g0204051 [Helianthus annuus]